MSTARALGVVDACAGGPDASARLPGGGRAGAARRPTCPPPCPSKAPEAVVICNEAVRSKEAADQQRGAAELEGVRRKAQRRSTPFVRPGDAEAFDEDSEGSQAHGVGGGSARWVPGL